MLLKTSLLKFNHFPSLFTNNISQFFTSTISPLINKNIAILSLVKVSIICENLYGVLSNLWLTFSSVLVIDLNAKKSNLESNSIIDVIPSLNVAENSSSKNSIKLNSPLVLWGFIKKANGTFFPSYVFSFQCSNCSIRPSKFTLLPENQSNKLFCNLYS